MGVIPINVEDLGIDFLAAGGHKWMMSPLGTGFFFVSQKLQEQLKPDFLNYMGKEIPEDYANYQQGFTQDARKFEVGVFNGIGIVGAKTATDLLLDAGIEHIIKHVLKLHNYLKEGLEELPFHLVHEFNKENQSGILMFSHDDASQNEAWHAKLTASDIIMSYRGGALRFAPHYYNTIEDVEILIEALSQNK
jgi:selenocysteine lyase/cysteine desulfurase